MVKIKVKIDGLGALKRYKTLTNDIQKVSAEGGGLSFLQRHQSDYRAAAQGIVQSEVYQSYTPKKYKRTYNLLNSIQFNQIAQGLFRLEVALNPQLRMVRPKGNEYYPILVIKGVTSTYPVPGYPKRDFYYGVNGWMDRFRNRFVNDFYDSVVRKVYPS